MASSSRRVSPLLHDLQDIEEWMSGVPNRILDEAGIPWAASHIQVVIHYVRKLEVSEFSYAGYRGWKNQDDKKFAKTAVSLAQNLRYLFEMPKLQQQLSDNKETTALVRLDLLATFISFLVELLICRTDSFKFFEDGIDCLHTQLRILFIILADKSFLVADELEQVFAEFEAVANDAGDLVHSFIFVSDGLLKSTRIVKALDALLRRISNLIENVRFSNMLSFTTSNVAMPPKQVFGDSLFVVDSFVQDLEDLMNKDDGLKNKVETLHQELLLSQSVLNGIKASSTLHHQELKECVTRLRNVAFEAEYLINSFLAGNAPLWYLNVRLSDQVIHKIKLIGAELQQIKKKCDIGASKVAKEVSAPISFPVKRTPEVDDVVVGFEDNANDIMDQLVGRREQLQIISIFGMPGLGKTTFAKKLYNHPVVTYRFDKLSWCVVSQIYHRKKLLVDVLMSLTDKFDKVAILNMDEESLVEQIYKSVKGRRYLIVMDDMWDSNAWDDMRICFPDDRNGSRILLTTRNKDVAPPGSIIHLLPFLSNDQCWELLAKKIFQSKPCPNELQGIGKEIAAYCNGLPLAVVVVAGILSTLDKEESMWKEVGGKLQSYIFDGADNYMMSIAELSYKHLSECLKLCFLYFGAFPEDTEVVARKLMRLWIAEGFIQKEEKKSAESVAEEYLMELIDKSLVIIAERRSDGGVKTCVMHDLLRELCMEKSKGKSFMKWVYQNYSINEDDHHLLNVTSLRVLDIERMLHARLIGVHFLVTLRYLVIDVMPTAVCCLVNLEFLQVYKGTAKLGPILKLLKLRYVHVLSGASYDKNCDISQVNKLEFLSGLDILSLKDEEMLRSTSPHLRKLKCHSLLWDEEKGTYRYPDLRFLTQLESLNMSARLEKGVWAELSFPSNIRKLTLWRLSLPWGRMSIIGGLPNLEVLKLRENAFVGEIWETRDGEFQLLRYLELYVSDLAQWSVASTEHFPKLQRLLLRECYDLREIPCEIGQIVTLQSIELMYCEKELEESAIEMEEEQRENGNEELRVIIKQYTY